MAFAERLLRQRWLVRAPILIFRLRLGGLTGGRLLLLEHRGRTTGARRSVVLEIIGTRDGGVLVSSGFGPRAQWFQNIVAEPRVLVSGGWRGPRRYLAQVLAPADGAAVLAAYVDRHPTAWQALAPVLRDWAVPLADQRGEQDWLRVVPVVALVPFG